MDKKYYSIKDVADLMGVSRVTVHYWLRKGRLKGFRASGPRGHLRFRLEDIEDMRVSGSSENKKAGS
ncbi:hypothetical protein ES707_06726 [subsurface metagenome]